VIVKKAESGDEAAKAVRIAFAASSPLSAFFTMTYNIFHLPFTG